MVKSPRRKSASKKPTHFKQQLNAYADYLKLRGLRPSSIETYIRCNRNVLNKFHSRGLRSLSEICPADIYAAFEASVSKEGFVIPVRSFLKYLFKKGLHVHDLSLIVPTVRRPQRVPSVYSKQETERILSGIDRSTPAGRRDYAVILLALRLGIRGGDIIQLKTGDINCEAHTIEFVQEKTLVPQRLELLPEVEEAPAAYLAERDNPQCRPYIFLSAKAPFKPLYRGAVYVAVAKHIKAAGIDAGERKRGSHAMRMTLASELAAESVPYDAIRRILGHESPESIKHYVKLDIEMLRKCALDAPKPIGRLAECLRDVTGGEA
jgi:integrase